MWNGNGKCIDAEREREREMYWQYYSITNSNKLVDNFTKADVINNLLHINIKYLNMFLASACVTG